ncbi:MAG: hypothetical protein HQ581_18130 [Planctomycetes bacterium]|nr:hypothetical protein [Planctomycetota bacterium]
MCRSHSSRRGFTLLQLYLLLGILAMAAFIFLPVLLRESTPEPGIIRAVPHDESHRRIVDVEVPKGWEEEDGPLDWRFEKVAPDLDFHKPENASEPITKEAQTQDLPRHREADSRRDAAK